MEKNPGDKGTIDASLALAKLCLQFGRTMRATHYEEGIEYESDTDHTVMLGIMAPAFAREFAPHLDRGKIAQFALIHDFAEVYAKDTPTFRIMSAEDIREKEERERKAIDRIKSEFDSVFPWIGETIEAYERLDTPEARFVKVMDKAMAKFVHIANDGATARELGHTAQSTREFAIDQVEKIRKSYGTDQPEALALLDALLDPLCNVTFDMTKDTQ